MQVVALVLLCVVVQFHRPEALQGTRDLCARTLHTRDIHGGVGSCRGMSESCASAMRSTMARCSERARVRPRVCARGGSLAVEREGECSVGCTSSESCLATCWGSPCVEGELENPFSVRERHSRFRALRQPQFRARVSPSSELGAESTENRERRGVLGSLFKRVMRSGCRVKDREHGLRAERAHKLSIRSGERARRLSVRCRSHR